MTLRKTLTLSLDRRQWFAVAATIVYVSAALLAYLLLSFADDPDEVQFSTASIAMELGPFFFVITLVPATQLVWSIDDVDPTSPTSARTAIRKSLLRATARRRVSRPCKTDEVY